MGAKEIAEERIRILFQQAEEKFEAEKELSSRYIDLALRIGERAQLPIPKDLNTKYCSECRILLYPGKNCQVRTDSSTKTVNYKCKKCGRVEMREYKEQ